MASKERNQKRNRIYYQNLAKQQAGGQNQKPPMRSYSAEDDEMYPRNKTAIEKAKEAFIKQFPDIGAGINWKDNTDYLIAFPRPDVTQEAIADIPEEFMGFKVEIRTMDRIRAYS